MQYTKALPAVHVLLELAQETKFPATRIYIETAADAGGYPQIVTDFLRLFPADEIFDSKVDFMTRCEELEMLINQQREASDATEILRSPDD